MASPNSTPYQRECLLCAPDKHPLYQCPKWGAFSISQKTTHINANKLCNNCLAGGHTTNACKSTYRCKDCSQKHHTSIHQASTTAPVNHANSHQVPDALMATANLKLIGPGGEEVRARALIDPGAGISLVTNRIAQLLHLPLEPTKLRLSFAQGETGKPLKYITSLYLSPLHNKSIKLICRPAVTSTVTANLPFQPMPSVTELPHLMGLTLADTTYNQPGRIDILLGADMTPSIITTAGPRKGRNTEPVAQDTLFGWALSGPVPGSIKEKTSAYHQLPILQTEPVPTSEPQLDVLLKAVLQEQDEVGDDVKLSTRDLHDQVEQHYVANTSFSNSECRYTVSLPRRDAEQTLGESKPQCTSRFLTNERSTLRKGTYDEFQGVVKGYITPGHAEEVPPEEAIPIDSFYMPMHAVYKDSSSSTKLRVVFDGCAASSNGLSLNQLLLAGPTIQATLTDTLIKFRSYPVALNADVAKMFREIKLATKDRDLHRFVWREHTSDQLKDYRMTRVTFGVSASPFLAIRTLHQIAEDQGEGYPEATQHIKSSFYVDDFLGGADNPEEALLLYSQLRTVLSRGGFQLRKWRSSSKEVLQHIPEELLEKDPVKSSTATNQQTNSKALGLLWNSHTDVMSPSICTPPSFKHTKRGLVSTIYRTYDVLGWISPTTLQMKIMIQQLWKTGHGWDIEAPQSAVDSYQKWKEELPVLKEKTIPRCYSVPGYEIQDVTLHGFSDASQTAYGAVVYYRTINQDHPPTIVLVTSKTKLAKLKTATIPRLELCAALLLAKLLESVGRVLDISPNRWHAWSDSSTVLAWLDGHQRQHPAYVANRVEQTLEITTPYIWHHVPTACNPADCASRGLKPTDLLQHDLWWNGPIWLQQEPMLMPPQPPRRTLPDAGPAVCVLQPTSSIPEQISNLSLNYPNIISTAAWCQRFSQRIQKGRPTPDDRPRRLTVEERKVAEEWLFRESQKRSFPRDISAIQKNKPISRDSRLKTLNPFLDKQQLLRLGGRLKQSDLSPSQKTPIILDGKDPLMEKFFKHLHISLCHCGPTLLLCAAGKELHVLGARKLSRRIYSQCVTCRRHRPRMLQQQMSDLPEQRVTHKGEVFSHTGLDYAGPFTLKLGRIRKPVKVEAYIGVFVCMATKVVHLEVVSDATTGAFHAALQRFVSRRGKPSHIYSDNGSNFLGYKNELQKLYSFLKEQSNNDEIHHYLSSNFNIEWHNIPPRSPHMGGLWEAAVKSMKTHLRRVVGETLLTFEELSTIACRVEACLNSRPLMPQSSHNPEGIDILTPGHFLMGNMKTALPEDPTPTDRPQLLKKWRRCQAMSHHFWTRWAKEYLNTLQARTKWQTTKTNLQVEDIVVIKPKEHFFSCHWPLGRIIKVLPGKDTLVRAVVVKTVNGTFQRAITQLALLYRPGEEKQAAALQEVAAPAPQPVQSRATSISN